MNPLLEQRNGKTYFGSWRINRYELACWLQMYNQILRTKIRPSTMTAEMFREFLAYQRRVRRMGFADAPILRERITLSVKHPRINEYAGKLSSTDRLHLAQIVRGAPVVVFHIDGERVSLAEQREAVPA